MKTIPPNSFILSLVDSWRKARISLSLLVHGRKVLLAPQTQTRSAQLTSVTRTNKLSLVYQTPLHNVWISTTSVEGRIKTIHFNRIIPKPRWGPSTEINLASSYWPAAQKKGCPNRGRCVPQGISWVSTKLGCHISGSWMAQRSRAAYL